MKYYDIIHLTPKGNQSIIKHFEYDGDGDLNDVSKKASELLLNLYGETFTLLSILECGDDDKPQIIDGRGSYLEKLEQRRIEEIDEQLKNGTYVPPQLIEPSES